MALSPQQTEAYDKIMSWLKTKEKRFVTAGYAGTGKSTLAKHISDEIGCDDIYFMAFTGKAANVLREKGIKNTGTIHSFLYKVSGLDMDAIHALEAEIEAADQAGNFVHSSALTERLQEMRKAPKQPRYQLHTESELKTAKLVLVDEYSMLDEQLINDIEKICPKVLYMGDPFQLPPVKGECSLQPDVFLTEIHRQALDNPIIRYSQAVREGRGLTFCNDGAFVYKAERDIVPEEYGFADQIIVGRNKTRNDWNSRFRMRKGYTAQDLPQTGEKMICLRNNPITGLFNGMIGTLKKNAKAIKGFDAYSMNFEDMKGLTVWGGDIRNDGSVYNFQDKTMKQWDRFDYAYAITAHKSQGSEFNNVLVYNQPVGMTDLEKRRWRYTALTRAKESVILVEPKS